MIRQYKAIFLIVLINYLLLIGFTIGGPIFTNWQNQKSDNQTFTDQQPDIKVRPTAKPACLVTIKDTLYDVIELRKNHTGGDIFICGTDMTTTFYSMHDEQFRLNNMQKYIVQN